MVAGRIYPRAKNTKWIQSCAKSLAVRYRADLLRLPLGNRQVPTIATDQQPDSDFG